jgi:hypothetical protein
VSRRRVGLRDRLRWRGNDQHDDGAAGDDEHVAHPDHQHVAAGADHVDVAARADHDDDAPRFAQQRVPELADRNATRPASRS